MTIQRFKYVIGAAVILGLSALQSPAAAEPRTHDGLFFQGSLGFGPGWLNEELKSGSAEQKLSLSGVTGTFELLLGGSPAPGFVIGGGIASHRIVNPTIKVGGQDFETDDTSVGITQISLFSNWYPQPTSGLYLHGAVGYAAASVTVGETTRDAGTSGIVLGVGAGYDFWIGKEWSLGPQFRLTYAHLNGEEGGVDATDNFISPTIALSATFH
jgi:outer membrane autotransporter protein